MPNLYYDQHTTALLLIDPYNPPRQDSCRVS